MKARWLSTLVSFHIRSFSSWRSTSRWCAGSVQEEPGPGRGRLFGTHGGVESWTGSVHHRSLNSPRETNKPSFPSVNESTEVAPGERYPSSASRHDPILLSEHLPSHDEIAPLGASRMQRLPHLISSIVPPAQEPFEPTVASLFGITALQLSVRLKLTDPFQISKPPQGTSPPQAAWDVFISW